MAPPGSAGGGESFPSRAGRFFYRYRSYTPIPLIVIALLLGSPSTTSWIVGAPLVVAGETLRLWSLRHIGGSSRSTRLGAERLVTSGPYASSRNPLYLGNFFLSLGLTVVSGVIWLPPLLVVLFVVQYGPIVLSEEEELARRFPDEYPRYAAAVPRFVPRIGRGGGAPPRWSWPEAVFIERRSLVSVALLLVCFAFQSSGGWPA